MEWNQFAVSHIERLTKDSVRLDLFPLGYGIEDFSFQAGQYLILETEIEGELVRRSYSICSAPSDNILSVGIKQVPNGRFSTFANQTLKVGDVLKVAKPAGSFVNSQEALADKQFVFFAAGSGITPILSMIKSTLEQSPNSKVILLFGNKSVRSIMFLEEIEALKNSYINRLQVFHILSKQPQDTEIFNGRIDRNKISLWENVCFNISETDAFFMCGPEAMILDLKDVLLSKGVGESSIHFELFTSNVANQAREIRKILNPDDQKSKKIEIQLDGKTLLFDFMSDDDNILDKALMSGADLPFACKGGVCCTCKAKLEEGEVNMYVNYGLEPDEIERGFILTCQSYPLTDKIVVNFDEV